MLTRARPKRPRPPPQSLRQEYEEFVLQRIEEFKDQLSREELLTLADEAVRELDTEAAEQLVLTEVLVLEHVDRLIIRRLRLPAYRRWRLTHVKLREAQRDPAHWGLARDTPLPRLTVRLGEPDTALVMGTGAGAVAAALYLAAHDVPVTFLGDDLAAVEAAEGRAAAEAVGSRFQALFVSLGGWLPDTMPSLVVMDAAMLATLAPELRARTIDALKERTRAGGVHGVLPAERRRDVIPLAMETLGAHYQGWLLEYAGRSGPRGRWFIATKP